MSRVLQTKTEESEEDTVCLSQRAEVRVSDLIGDLAEAEASRQAAQWSRARVPSLSSSDLTLPARSARKSFGLSLGWYDWGVVSLILASLVAGVICLLKGV